MYPVSVTETRTKAIDRQHRDGPEAHLRGKGSGWNKRDILFCFCLCFCFLLFAFGFYAVIARDAEWRKEVFSVPGIDHRYVFWGFFCFCFIWSIGCLTFYFKR